MRTELEYIEYIITNHTAMMYAEIMLGKEKNSCEGTHYNLATHTVTTIDMTYKEYMTQAWSTKNKATLEECIEASRISKLNHYAKMIEMYTGWVKNGKLFVLNKKEKFVSFLYELKRESESLDSPIKSVIIRTNYNPLKVDCIEDNINPKYLSKQISDENYDISQNELQLIEDCNKLCFA